MQAERIRSYYRYSRCYSIYWRNKKFITLQYIKNMPLGYLAFAADPRNIQIPSTRTLLNFMYMVARGAADNETIQWGKWHVTADHWQTRRRWECWKLLGREKERLINYNAELIYCLRQCDAASPSERAVENIIDAEILNVSRLRTECHVAYTFCSCFSWTDRY